MKFPIIISQIWMGLGREGWGLGTSTTSLLPGGWRIKWVEEVGGELFSSDFSFYSSFSIKKQVGDWHYLSRQCQVLRGTSRARVELATSPEEHDAADLER